MANFYGTARSNYFKVKDEAKFKEWVDSCPGLGRSGNLEGFMIYSDDPDSGTWPCYRWDEEEKDHVEIDLASELSEHLVEGEIAVLVEAGAEKLRYISAWAVAVNWKGEAEYLNLDRIYSLAEERWGIRPTVAEH